ncbi:putative transcriptional regulator, AsnC family [Ferroglobus placidus DSM 10642]|uniref:Putative transcriptional regulator, AsnC family n=1 Tax=Ferroglobus placidus (strain DSM 10642 / AEDII12DO) TaxID=589924 RepID=D3S1W2_FERPA|nr:ArsR family transcriptional regulator [Ferroglobus placidus]ADC64419.1 putative transcriptional regulator, AsnC family [Ferroglobus placidus DSM 10642]
MDSSSDDVFYIEKLHSEKAKLLASEISNETARQILKELYKNPASITDLSNKLDIPLSTVQYHINKLIELGVIKLAQKRLGKRLRDVKMYVYDKESIVFLSSMEKHEFEHLLRTFVLQRLKKGAPIAVLLIFTIGSILSLIGSWLFRREIESRIGSFYDIAGGAFGILEANILLVFLGIFFLLGVVSSFLLFLFIIKKTNF